MATKKLKYSYSRSHHNVPPLLQNVPELIDIRGTQHPDREAYVIRDGEKPREAITFGELKHRTAQLAAALIERGLKKGERVALLCPTSVDYVVCEYSVARTGAILVRVQSSLNSGEDLRYLLKKSGTRWIIAHPGTDGSNYTLLKKVCPSLLGEQAEEGSENELPNLEKIFMLGDEPHRGVVLLKTLTENVVHDLKEVETRERMFTQDDVMALNTTSGSTGLPKLVAQPYSYSKNIWRNASLKNGISEKDIYITDRPMTYSGGNTGPALSIGYTMVYVLTRSTVSSGSEGAELFLRLAKEEKCTVMLMFMYLLIDFVRLEAEGTLDMGLVHTGLFSGQSINEELCRKCMKIVPRFLNMYGSTESGLSISCNASDPVETVVSCAGVAVDGEVKIVDEEGNLVPVNTIGEMCLRSINLFTEYWGDEEKTRQVKDAGGWFHSGDMASMDEDGYIKVIGRTQEVITRASVKVYPLPLENMIIKHPKVALVTVIGVPDARLHQTICACLIVEKGEKLTEKEIRQYCDDIFGEDEDGLSFSPKYYVFLDTFPAGTTGKVDRGRVKEIAVSHLGLQ